MKSIKSELSKLLADALNRRFGSSLLPEALESTFTIPREDRFGDITTSIVLKLAKENKQSPRPCADALAQQLETRLDQFSLRGRIFKILVEGPGFINFYFSDQEIASVILRVREEGRDFGKPKGTVKKKILLEFVSANPTGPLTVAHGRQAALGDSLARLLRFCGHEVITEYYNNDEGVQIRTLGASTRMRVQELASGHDGGPLPENYYQGAYLVEIAGELLKQRPQIVSLPETEQLKICAEFAKDAIMRGIQKDLAAFEVVFDAYYSQAALARSGRVEQTLEALKAKNVLYENEGAWWFRSTDFGDDKDRVLIKSDKTYTYFTPDIAYHQDKFERGFDELIDILGPDHHGYIARLKASQAALGHAADQIHILIAQLVTLFEGTRQVRMSTRAGEFVTLRQILDAVGKDAGRFFFVMRKFDAHLDFDLELAKSQTPQNPVFYIQYCHARVESIKNQATEKNIKIDWSETARLSKLNSPMEIRVMRLLAQFETTVLDAQKTLEPHCLVPYLMDLAASFHRFYAEHRVISDDAELTQARLMLASAVQTVVKSGLELLGVSAPLKM